jgi:flagellar L-ring protein precursor FlgH
MNANKLTASKIKFMLMLVLLMPAAAKSQSLWSCDTSTSIFADKRSLHVGDILTIVVSENSTANKNNSTSTERKSSLSAAVTAFLFPPGATPLMTVGGQLPAMAFNSDHIHNGNGAISDSENIVAQVAVHIVDVLPNGNLVVEGKRETSFSMEHQTMILRGEVRPDDVNGNNTVFSYNVADATIQILGKGTVSDGQDKGWFNRLWDKINPF